MECNTLPENKRYILGCQCGFCKGGPREIKDELYCSVNGSVSKFIQSIGGVNDESFCNGIVSPSDFYDYDYKTFSTGYNFMKDGFYSQSDNGTLDSPIYFSREIEEFYKIWNFVW